jgi:hypothetical protein
MVHAQTEAFAWTDEWLLALSLSPIALKTAARMPANEQLTANGPARECETHRLSCSLNCILNS